ncbi:MAG: hypothetical protein LOD90_06860, partial [Symbiobacteriaceae bacterium]
QWLRLATIFILAAGCGYVAASVLFTLANLIRLSGIGAEISAADAWRTILFDLRGMAPSPVELSYGSVIFIGLAIAFTVAAWLRWAASRAATPAPRRLAPWLFPLAGATAVAVGGWAEEWRAGGWRRLALPLGLGTISVVLAAPTIGSNFGGGLAGAMAATGPVFRGLVALRRRPALARKALVTALAVPAAVVAMAVAWDRLLGPASTHVWVSLDQVRQVGPQAMVDLVTRKAAMNVKLMRFTNWSYLFLMSVFAFALLMYRRPALVRQLERGYPETVRALTSIAAGAVAALILNDSGIVAAATLMVYGVSLLLALATDPPGDPAHGPNTPRAGTGDGWAQNDC